MQRVSAVQTQRTVDVLIVRDPGADDSSRCPGQNSAEPWVGPLVAYPDHGISTGQCIHELEEVGTEELAVAVHMDDDVCSECEAGPIGA